MCIRDSLSGVPNVKQLEADCSIEIWEKLLTEAIAQKTIEPQTYHKLRKLRKLKYWAKAVLNAKILAQDLVLPSFTCEYSFAKFSNLFEVLTLMADLLEELLERAKKK